MRVGNIQAYLGGADNLYAYTMLQGELRIFNGTWHDSSGDPIDISSGNYEITARSEFYEIQNLIVASNKITLSGSLTLLDNPSIRDLHVEITDGVNGKFAITFPEGFYVDDGDGVPIELPIDVTTDVPMALTYIKYADRSNAPDDIIRMSRLLTIIRRGQ